MKKHKFYPALLLTALTVVWLNAPSSAEALLAWGSDAAYQVTDLPTETDYVALATGDAHGLALASDGAVVAWGHNGHGQCDVPAGTYTAVGAGALFSLAIRTDGTIAAWGDDRSGQVSGVPTGSDFVAIDGGLHFAVALRGDGSIAAWGDDRNGQVSGVPKGDDFVSVAAGDAHAVALRSNGALVSWGYVAAIDGTPATGAFTAISAGGDFCLALTDRGQIVWWGDDVYGFGLANVPTGSDFVDIAAGYLHALAIRSDGTAVGWGAGADLSEAPELGQAIVPERNDYTAVAGGLYFSAALTDVIDLTAASDDFDDNGTGIQWSLRGVDLNNCRLDETNQRLELRATTKSDGFSAFYFSNGWGIDPTMDFSLRVNYHLNVKAIGDTRLSMLLTPHTNSGSSQRIEFGVASDSTSSYTWIAAFDGTRTYTKSGSRGQNDGVLYVSYAANRDELYVSTTGFGAAQAWATAKGFLRDGWGSRVINVALGGGSDRQEIGAGGAYLDDFVVESGNPMVTGFNDVYRFWSPVTNTHFYTINEQEKDYLVANYPAAWSFEGPVFKAATTPLSRGLEPVFRFWSNKTGAHFYTIDEIERNGLLDAYAHVWLFEGVAFYAYPEGKQPSDAKGVYRFWNVVTGAHFYTIDEKEKDKIIRDYPKIYAFEGVAFYTYD